MDLEVKQVKGKWYVKDRETGQDMNKGKPFPNRQSAVKFLERSMGASELGGAGEKLMPKGMPSMAAMMGGGAMPMPGMPGQAPSQMDKVMRKPGGMY